MAVESIKLGSVGAIHTRVGNETCSFPLFIWAVSLTSAETRHMNGRGMHESWELEAQIEVGNSRRQEVCSSNFPIVAHSVEPKNDCPPCEPLLVTRSTHEASLNCTERRDNKNTLKDLGRGAALTHDEMHRSLLTTDVYNVMSTTHLILYRLGYDLDLYMQRRMPNEAAQWLNTERAIQGAISLSDGMTQVFNVNNCF